MPDPLYRTPTRTRVLPVALLTAFGLAFVELTGRPVDTAEARNLVELVTVQARHEMADDATTAADDDVAWCWNLTGNKRPKRKPGLLDARPWTTLGTHELVWNAEADRLIAAGLAEEEHHPHDAPPGKRAVYFKNLGEERSHVAAHFLAFDSLDEGALFSLSKYLVEGSRYATSAVQAALYAGDARRFAAELKLLGYYTSTLNQYASALVTQLATVGRDSPLVDWAGLPLVSARRARALEASAAAALWGSVRQSQQGTLADLERERREREGNGES